jgi:hypothetical protein
MVEKNKLEIEIEKTTSENISEYKEILEELAQKYIITYDSIQLYKQTLKDIEKEAIDRGVGADTLKLYVESRRIKKNNTFQYELLVDKLQEE